MGPVAYRLVLPPSLSGALPVFYVSMSKKFHGDSNHLIHWNSVLLDETLSYEEETIAILDRDVHKLRTKDISIYEGLMEESSY